MKTEHSYSAKGVLTALGRSALYLLFFVAVQVLLPFVYGIGIAADAAINRGADLAQGAQAVAERLRQAIRSLSGELTGLSTPITISGGLALTTAEDQDFEAVVARADEALYSAKVLGRDRMVVRSAALQPSLAEGK